MMGGTSSSLLFRTRAHPPHTTSTDLMKLYQEGDQTPPLEMANAKQTLVDMLLHR